MLDRLFLLNAGLAAVVVFVLLSLQSVAIITLEFQNDLDESRRVMSEDAQRIVYAIRDTGIDNMDDTDLSSLDNNRTRIFDAEDNLEHVGLLFQSEEPTLFQDEWYIESGNRNYRVLTFPIYQAGEFEGNIQIAEPFESYWFRLQKAGFVITFMNLVMAAITFGVSIFFQKRTAQHTAEMIEGMEYFAQNAGHELKTPLANLQSSLDVALKSKEYEECIKEAKEDVVTMTELIDRLLALETLSEDSVKKTAINMSAITKETVAKFASQAKEQKIALQAVVTDSVVRLADEHLFRDLLTNLLQNAFKFTGENGHITVTLDHQKLSIRDTGIGMTQAIIEKIFDRFFKADFARSNQGFGLGLSLVRKIIKIHNWRLDVESEPGKGSTFFIHFG